MRELKFRAWDKEEKEMYLPETENNHDGFFAGFDRGKLQVQNFDSGDEHVTLMQYTGLKDKNGKEIYEGDVVKGSLNYVQLLTWDTDEKSNFQMGGVVFYDHSGFRLECIQPMCEAEREGNVNYFDFIGADGEIFEEMEVIGNIYENPELIENYD